MSDDLRKLADAATPGPWALEWYAEFVTHIGLAGTALRALAAAPAPEEGA